MKNWWIVLGLMLSLGVNAGLLVSRFTPAPTPVEEVPEEPPRPEPFDPRPGPAARELPRVIYRMADELRLEGEKRERFVELQHRFLRRSMAARFSIQRSSTQLRHELLGAEPDRGVAERSLAELARARGELEKAFVENVLETRELLDEEENRRFLRMIARLRQSAEQRFQRGPDRPFPRREGLRRPPPGR